MSAGPSSEQPWHAAYPKPVSTAVFLPRSTVVDWLVAGSKVQGKDFVLVDLRRMDHEVGCPSPLPHTRTKKRGENLETTY